MGKIKEDLTGKVFGLLTITGPSERHPGKEGSRFKAGGKSFGFTVLR